MAGDGRGLIPLAAGRLFYARDASATRERVVFAGLSVLATIVTGVLGFWLLGGGAWPLADCLYMVLITITTVGYAEVLPIEEVLGGRLFTSILLVSGMGVSLYFMSALTAFIIEGDLAESLWRRKMQRRLDTLKGHYIVCGAGQTGRSVVDEMIESGKQVVAVELDPTHLERLHRKHGEQVIFVEGDATDDELLLRCGVDRAAGLFATLHNDRDNLFVTVSARQLNRDLRVVSRSVEDGSDRKLLNAGAASVVSPNHIGGRRMALEMLHPRVLGFLDLIVRETQQNLAVEECVVPPGSPVAGKTLATSGIRKAADVLILSVVDAGGAKHTFNPAADFELKEGQTLVALGTAEAVERFDAYVQPSR